MSSTSFVHSDVFFFFFSAWEAELIDAPTYFLFVVHKQSFLEHLLRQGDQPLLYSLTSVPNNGLTILICGTVATILLAYLSRFVLLRWPQDNHDRPD